MKAMILIFCSLWCAGAFAAPSKTMSAATRIKTCLSHLYTAQKAYYEEKKVYSDNPKELGFSSDVCDDMDRVELNLSSNKKRFMAAVAKGRHIATIDDQKNLN